MTKTPSLGQIDNRSLRDQVLDSLRSAIVNGELKPGETLVETDLAAQLGVSRAPLREAINILNVEGLVETIPYHGTKVRKLRREDIEDLYSVRGMMEVFAINQIIAAGPKTVAATAAALKAMCAEMTAAADQDDLTAINQIDRRFHDTLIEYCGNALLGLLWGSVTLRVQQVMSLRNEHKGDLHQIAKNHAAIVTAIADANADEAVKLLYEHIGSIGDFIAETWKELDDETEEVES